jgi:hypothetical protein
MATAMVSGAYYMFICSVACWIKQAVATYLETYAELDLGTLADGDCDTVVRYATRGTAGNAVTVELVGDSAPAGGVTIDESTDDVVIHYESGVSTVANVETAVSASTKLAVKTAGTAGTVLTAPADDFEATALAGGGEDDLAEVTAPIAAAADASVYIPAGTITLIDGMLGDSLSVVRASGDGTASLTRARID